MPSFDPKEYMGMTTQELLDKKDALTIAHKEATELIKEGCHSELVIHLSELNRNKIKERLEEINRRLRFKGITQI